MKLSAFLFLVLFIASCSSEQSPTKQAFNTSISKQVLQDKIKGGWAGQVIGCTYGGPTEFKYNGTMIQDYTPIPWDDTRCKWYFENAPGLYDDVYMDLTFVDVFEKEGLDAPASSHALAFANADYSLWHANQAARYNILNGIMPPASGSWINNPHSEDIDFQIEADFAGLMAPGMPNVASEVCDKIGHIMNYGDGWYGGVYVAAMYSLSFVSDDVKTIVTEALKTIPAESQFHQCIADVIKWHEMYPEDWKQNWFECQKKWSSDIGCPEGVFSAFNIDAKINAAYIVIGLLYGDKDFTKTLDISTRCGFDSDCNPASAGGILGTILGYSNIPDYWMKGLKPIEDMDFRYTEMSLKDVYSIGYKQALQMLEKNNIETSGNELTFTHAAIQSVPLEIGFEGHYPIEKNYVGKTLNNGEEFKLNFRGNGIVIMGYVNENLDAKNLKDPVLEVTVDGESKGTFTMPACFKTRKHDLFWDLNLTDTDHEVIVKVISKEACHPVFVSNTLVYSSQKPM